MDSGSASGLGWRAVAAASTAMCGVLTVASSVTADVPARHALLRRVEPGSVMALGHVLGIGAGIALVYLARGLLDRRRRALDASVVVLVVVAVLHLVKGLDYEESVLALMLAALLLPGRRAFTRGSAWRPPLLALTVGVGAITAFYVVLCTTFTKEKSLSALIDGAARLLASGAWLRTHEPARTILMLLFAAAAAAVLMGVRGLLRPKPAREGHSPEEHTRAVAIVRQHGADSLAPFVLREDKAFFFAHDGFVAYRTLRETAVVSGDPIGPPGSAGPILAAFLRYADARGWRIAVAAASSELAQAAELLGLSSLQVGCEAVVDARAFTLEGRAVRKVRQAIARVERHGWTTTVVAARDLADGAREQIAELEREFTMSRPHVYGFAMSLGRLWGAPEDDDALYALGCDPEGDVGAFIRFLPYGRGLSLDAVRRRPDMPNGVCEALVVEAIGHARAAGLDEVSLNFAGFAHIMAPTRPLRRRERLLRAGLTAAHGRFQLERLAVFGNHFTPAWRPRFIVYGGALELATSALRVLQSERYIRAPRVAPLTPRWEPSTASLPTLPQFQRR